MDSTSAISIDAATRLVTLLGDPVEHSRSPQIHNTGFAHHGINAVYLATPVLPEALPEAIAGLRALHILGANVTIPHKQAVLPLLDDLTPRARAVGAVNTIARTGDDAQTLRGDNTDVPGFLDPLEALHDRLQGAPMLILGSGGAARAVAYALLTTFAPEALTLAARSPDKAEQLAADLSPHDSGEALRVVPLSAAGPSIRASRLVVNATPVGMHPNPDDTPWPAADDFSAEHIVYDLVYNPRETRLLREAAARGATPIGGLAMLIGQAAAAFEQWTGQPLPTDRVRDALRPPDEST
jgi:shikimate dehydrogenase